jgi:hypothetical protein
MVVFWLVKWHHHLGLYQSCGGSCCFRLQGQSTCRRVLTSTLLYLICSESSCDLGRVHIVRAHVLTLSHGFGCPFPLQPVYLTDHSGYKPVPAEFRYLPTRLHRVTSQKSTIQELLSRKLQNLIEHQYQTSESFCERCSVKSTQDKRNGIIRCT